MTALGTVLLVVPSCVVPPPIEEEPVSDHPPVIDDSLVEPTAGTVVQLDLTTTPTPEFTVEGATADEDGDQLYWNWYLLTEPGDASKDPVRTRPWFVFRPCGTHSDSVPPADDDGPRFMYLEIDVSDRPVLQGTEEEPLEQPRTYPEDAVVLTRSWILMLQHTCL